MPPPLPATKATHIGHSGLKSSIMLVHGACDIFYVKMGPRITNYVKNGKNVMCHGQCYHFFIVNCVERCKKSYD